MSTSVELPKRSTFRSSSCLHVCSVFYGMERYQVFFGSTKNEIDRKFVTIQNSLHGIKKATRIKRAFWPLKKKNRVLGRPHQLRILPRTLGCSEELRFLGLSRWGAERNVKASPENSRPKLCRICLPAIRTEAFVGVAPDHKKNDCAIPAVGAFQCEAKQGR